MDRFEKVAQMLADYKGIDVSEIKMESGLTELGFDSLDVAELVMAMEDEFGVSIELDPSVKTVGALLAKLAESEA